MPNLAAAPVLSGTLADDWLDVGEGAILGVETMLMVALGDALGDALDDALAVSLTDSTVICPVLALLVKVATEVD